ncbi:MAG: FAD-binding oxidoreductase [Candidatus Zambryskibacteria bacterium]|nr:FAD-binding oxidoreductase [Candidatus Zambryskibacteria bacterium]
MRNNSPWLHQLNKEREPSKLAQDIETDVAVVGGGIAGVASAFFILRDTDKKVALLEGGLLGHGATGHNAGQIVSFLSRPLHDLAKEFKPEMVREAQKMMEEDAWELLDTMYTEAGLDISLSRFTGHFGFASKEHLLSLLEDNVLRKSLGLRLKEILIAEQAEFLEEVGKKYGGFFKIAPHSEILDRLETKKPEFIVCVSEQKGVMNSALFTERVAEYLLEKYPERFAVYEHTHIAKAALHENSAILDAETHAVTAERVILCTNGFDNITIFNKSGLDIDARFHHSLHAVVGYMSGYLEELNKPPTAISYFYEGLTGDDSSGNPYVYLTRRMYEYNENKHNLISIGGPDVSLDDRRKYEKDHEYPEWAKDEINKFVKEIYDTDPNKKIDYIFTWHGLMGYTNNKLRLIGAEPKNPVLLYNLGCNGVGILPSIFGGERIARLVKGEKLPASIFDPRVERAPRDQ